MYTPVQQVVADTGERGLNPGAVAAIVWDGRADVGVSGLAATDGPAMARDTVFRIASVTKPIVAAAAMALVDRGVFEITDPVANWLPELADPVVVRTPESAVDDVVPADRPITVEDLLTFRSGHGFLPDFGLPVVRLLMERAFQGPPRPQAVPPPDEWLARLATVPLAHQPGEGWTYNTGADILGVLLARAAGAPLPEVLRETVLDPLGMDSTAFAAPAGRPLPYVHRREQDGTLVAGDDEGGWTTPPAFPSGAGGLVSTLDDLLAFGAMLLNEGRSPAGRQVLAPSSVEAMLTPHVTAAPGNPFLQGQAWGYGGSVDIEARDPWNVPGRYGWVGGFGTAFYVTPATRTTAVWLTQVEMRGPDDFAGIADFLTLAARPA